MSNLPVVPNLKGGFDRNDHKHYTHTADLLYDGNSAG